jgi:threonine aldolase
MKRERVLDVLIGLLAVLIFVAGYTSMRENRRIGGAQAKIAIYAAQRDQALAREKVLRVAVAQAKHAAAAAHDTASRAEQKLRARVADDRSRPPVVITDTTAVRAELARKDSIIDESLVTIGKKNAEIARLNAWHLKRDSVDVEREERYLAVARINSELKALVPSRVSKVVTASKWLAVGFAIGSVVR